MSSGFTSSAFWISMFGLGVTAYLGSASTSISVSLIVMTYNLTNAWVKK